MSGTITTRPDGSTQFTPGRHLDAEDVQELAQGEHLRRVLRRLRFKWRQHFVRPRHG